MAGSTARNARFLIYTGPVSGPRVWVTVPAWAHRVTAPLIRRRGLDLFQRVILGLSQAGVRSTDQMSELTGLHPRLCGYIVDQSRQQCLLDRAGEVTAQGRRALRTDTITNDDTEWSVRYVFTDPASGDLWPRATEKLTDAYVRSVTAERVVAELGTAGKPVSVSALRMPAHEDPPARPRPDQVLEVVRRDRQARAAARDRAVARRYNLGAAVDPPDEYGGRIAADEPLPELSQVTFIGEPQQVEILAVIEAPPADEPGPGWVAHDPFGVGATDMFSELVMAWTMQHAALAAELEQITGQRAAQFAADRRKARQRDRDRAEDELIREYGPELRGDAGVVRKLIDLRIAEWEEESGRAMQASFGLFEELMFRFAVAFPIPADFADPSERVRASRIREAAQRAGAHQLPHPFTSVNSHGLAEIANRGRPAQGAPFITVAAACLIAAGRRKDHPLRSLLQQRPNLMFELNDLRDLRNGQAHRLGERTVTEDLHWCKDLARLAVPQLLRLPAIS